MSDLRVVLSVLLASSIVCIADRCFIVTLMLQVMLNVTDAKLPVPKLLDTKSLILKAKCCKKTHVSLGIFQRIQKRIRNGD